MSSLPPDLQKLWDDTIEADRAAEGLDARLTDEEFFWRPDQGRRWSVALCLDHLAVANTTYIAALREAVSDARRRGSSRRGPASPGFFGRKFIESLEPPPTRRTRAPNKIRPMPARTREEILLAYRKAHDEVRRTILEAAPIDINRVKFRNPFISLIRMKVATGLQVISAHDRRHLWQAAQVEKELRARGRT